MIRQWIEVGFAVVIAAAALSACSGKGAGTSKGDSCGTAAPSTGQCGGAASACGSPPVQAGVHPPSNCRRLWLPGHVLGRARRVRHVSRRTGVHHAGLLLERRRCRRRDLRE